MRKRGLPSAAMLLWGLQFSFLNPARAFILVDLFDADAPTVGGIFALYNLSGVVGSFAIAHLADRRRGYLIWVVVGAVAALALAVVLFSTTSLLVVVIALVLLGGPAAGGVPLLFAQLRASGGRPADVVRARAVFSLAWVGGPPLATFVISAFGARAELGVIAGLATLNVVIGLLMLRARASYADPTAQAQCSGGAEARQQIIARPGIASSLFTNTVQLGGVAAGPLIAIAGASAFSYRGVFAGAGVLAVIGVTFIGIAALRGRRR